MKVLSTLNRNTVTGILVLQFCLFLIAFNSFSQPVNVSGVINTYTPVVSIFTNDYKSVVEVKSKYGFKSGDKVLIIQMKGASIKESNSPEFGSIVNYNGAGNFEFSTIAGIVGERIVLRGKLSKQYEISGKVQLIKVPDYQYCTVTELLKARPWDGNTGGVLVFTVSETLTLQSDIDISGSGFRGGHISNNHDGYCGISSASYYYPLDNKDSVWQEGGAMKGEGITEVDFSKMAGKGSLGNGGGGGSKHNAGGGGGGNYTQGGKGGNEIGLCETFGNGGIGGNSINYFDTRAFLGGGGGCGDYNDKSGSDGTNGGGIIIIRAKKIIGNNHSIKNNGLNQTIEATSIGDGAGGGGAGGTTMIDADIFETNLIIEAIGGNGGNPSPKAFVACFGTGGGGGSGLIWVSPAKLPNYVLPFMKPGNAGQVMNPNLPCFGTSYGAENGVVSTIRFKPGLKLFEKPLIIAKEEEIPPLPEFYVTERLQFEQSKFNLLDQTKTELDRLAEVMQKHPMTIVEFMGHTDNVGFPTMNYRLSEMRLIKVKEYLIKKGIPDERIRTIAFGETKPAATNETEEGKVQNRRVEVKLITNDRQVFESIVNNKRDMSFN